MMHQLYVNAKFTTKIVKIVSCKNKTIIFFSTKRQTASSVSPQIYFLRYKSERTECL